MMRKPIPATTLLLLIVCLGVVPSSIAQTASQMPKVEGDSFSGHKVTLPDATAGKIAVLIFGFTRASKTPTGEWAKKITADFGTRPGFDLYQLPVLEDVPRLIRGMVISGIRKGVAENVRDHFVPIVQGEDALKKLVNYKEPDDAYVVILGRTGAIVQQIHGSPSDTNYSPLRTEIESLLNQK